MSADNATALKVPDLSSAVVRDMLGCSEPSLWRYTTVGVKDANGEPAILKCYRVGGKKRFFAADVWAFIERLSAGRQPDLEPTKRELKAAAAKRQKETQRILDRAFGSRGARAPTGRAS